MRIDEGARSVKRTLAISDGARDVLERKRRRWERWALSVEVKVSPLPPFGFIDPWSNAPRITRSAHINCR
jgi:hypothetical protein